MDRRYLSPLELLSRATQHVYAAHYLLEQLTDNGTRDVEALDNFSPVITLMYNAFQLLFKAYCLHEHRPVKEYKNLIQLMELNTHLGMSIQEQILIKTLSRQHAFHKGVEFDLWEDQQQLNAFCVDIISLYERIQMLMPLELQKDYLV